ncbi:MAG: VOC family protein [Acidobacteria bacterium]|nr:VOC family protein [Acidobacteriota bacterium]
MRRLATALTLLLLLSLAPVRAQLASPNPTGVSMGHLHYVVRNVEANRKFWIDFGATPVKFGDREVLKLPEVFIFLDRGEPSGGTEGSVVNHVAFRLPDIPKALTRFRSLGVRVLPQNPGSPIGNILTPEGERIELFHDGTENVPFHLDDGRRDVVAERLGRPMTTPVTTHHFHLHLPVGQSKAAKTWYVRMFGALPGTRRGSRRTDGTPQTVYLAADIPGMNINFLDVEEKLAPTKGRMLDHIGFEVRNLEAFCRKLEAGGVKFARPYRRNRGDPIATALLVDPWGTSIELTEGLSRY